MFEFRLIKILIQGLLLSLFLSFFTIEANSYAALEQSNSQTLNIKEVLELINKYNTVSPIYYTTVVYDETEEYWSKNSVYLFCMGSLCKVFEFMIFFVSSIYHGELDCSAYYVRMQYDKKIPYVQEEIVLREGSSKCVWCQVTNVEKQDCFRAFVGIPSKPTYHVEYKRPYWEWGYAEIDFYAESRLVHEQDIAILETRLREIAGLD